jgi:hypothetical protein
LDELFRWISESKDVEILKGTNPGIIGASSSLVGLKPNPKATGFKPVVVYLVMGRYDTVAIGEAPDDKTAAKIALTIGSKGALRTETFRAFTEDEYRKIIAELP